MCKINISDKLIDGIIFRLELTDNRKVKALRLKNFIENIVMENKAMFLKQSVSEQRRKLRMKNREE